MSTRNLYSGPCSLESAFQVFAGRWKPAIIYFLLTEDVLRFGELRRKLPEVSQRVLTANLRQLERDGIVTRTEYEGRPARVEYSLTEIGASLEPIMALVEKWSGAHLPVEGRD